jgi:hypothetical protein
VGIPRALFGTVVILHACFARVTHNNEAPKLSKHSTKKSKSSLGMSIANKKSSLAKNQR